VKDIEDYCKEEILSEMQGRKSDKEKVVEELKDKLKEAERLDGIMKHRV